MGDAVRLQKFLSAAGIASRRKAEVMITAGRVSVNGKKCTELGTKVDPSKDAVSVDGTPVKRPELLYYLMHKPRATLCTESDPEGRDRVHDLLPKHLPRLFTVGRLDYDNEGVLLFTTDGELAKALTDPKQAVTRVYEVKIQGEPDPHLLRRFNEGLRLDDGRRTKPSPTELIKRTKTNAWYEVVLTEGMNRQIHRMAMACGRTVLKIRRIAYGPVRLGALKLGRTRQLTPMEVGGLINEAGLKGRRRAAKFKDAHDERDVRKAKAKAKAGGKPRSKGGGKPKPKSGGRPDTSSRRRSGPRRKQPQGK